MNKKSRSYDPEWIDLGPSYYTSEEYRDCLVKLDQIGRYLGGDRATLWAFEQLAIPPASILDVGCGGGLFTGRLAARYPQAYVVGNDISSEALTFAKEVQKQNPSLKNLHFDLLEEPKLNYPSKSFDVVTATLVCHHLTDEQLVAFLQDCCRIAKQAVILNDLHRHMGAAIGFNLIAPLFFRNRLIVHDGLLSIKRAFTRQDWAFYLKEARISDKQTSITWHFPFRWVVSIHPTKNTL